MEKKKGLQLSQAFGAVLVVILVAILVIVALVIFGAVGAVSSEAVTTLSEASTLVDAGNPLDDYKNCSFSDPIILGIHNATWTIESGNYTVNATGWIFNATTGDYGPVVVNYSYTGGGATCDAADSMITQFATYPVLIGLVGTIVFLGLVIGVLVASFVFGGRRRV